MSKLTQAIGAIAGFFEHNQAASAAAAPAVQNLNEAAQNAEAALPAIANATANAALAALGPLASEFAPLADEFIDLVIAALESKKSVPKTA